MAISFYLGDDSDLDFLSSDLNLPYFRKIRKTKKYDSMLGIRCGNLFGPRPCHWPWIFNVRYLICYISGKYDSTAMKRKMYISIERNVSNVASFYFGIDLDLFTVMSLQIYSSSWPQCSVYFKKHKYMFSFSLISQIWDNRLYFKPSPEPLLTKICHMGSL